VGGALVRHAVRQAAAMGVPRLYLHTGSARAFYERLGWRPVASAWYEGEPVTVMQIVTSNICS
jgi:N-acetylglutamate synthase-like GNAT family acetyltransferase